MRTIGKLARESGVNVETVRFYERRGLLRRPAERTSGWRLYDDESVLRIHFIKRAQQLGFTLAEIDDLLALRHAKRRSCASVRRLAEEKVADIETRIRDLKSVGKALSRLVTACRSEGDDLYCPILESIAKEPGMSGKLRSAKAVSGGRR